MITGISAKNTDIMLNDMIGMSMTLAVNTDHNQRWLHFMTFDHTVMIILVITKFYVSNVYEVLHSISDLIDHLWLRAKKLRNILTLIETVKFWMVAKHV